MPAGYASTPLAKKLGLKEGLRVWAPGMPQSVKDEIAQAAAVTYVARPSKGLTAAHLFVTRKTDLAAKLEMLRGAIAQDGQVWASWPKKAAKVETDITEDVIRAVALPMGFVDVKVCAVDEVWSGLKLVIRKTLRKP
ncbi:MAG: DUF3052 family protein [Alphaproteobacteria bacterium]|nr:DUF3052 family protein [Alphaproteobacteria bacterium]